MPTPPAADPRELERAKEEARRLREENAILREALEWYAESTPNSRAAKAISKIKDREKG